VTVEAIGLGRARRHRWLTALVIGGISLTALAVGITYWMSVDRNPSLVQTPPSPAADVNRQFSGYTFTRSDQGRPVFTVHAARTVSYQQSKSTTLQDVTVEVFGRKGDSGDILRTHECQYNSQSGDFFGSGPVEIELSANSKDIPGSGLKGKHRIFLETSKVSYHQDEEIAETDQPVTFHMGPASGNAVGMIYATRDGWLELRHNVVVDLVQGSEKSPQPPIHLTASALRYDKDDGRVALTGPVEVIEDKRRAVSEKAEIQLDARNRVSKVNLDGHAKAFDVNSLRTVDLGGEHVQGDFDPASGQVKHLTVAESVAGESLGATSTSHVTAQKVEMSLGGKHPQPQQGVATGNVHMDAESQPVLNIPDKSTANTGPEKKTLTANAVQFSFRPDTHGLKDANTVGPGTVVITPADPKSGQKVINAGQFLMGFDARSHIESLKGVSSTQVTFHPPANAPAGATNQQSQADRLDAVFDPGTQTVREIRQSGNFQYRDGDRQASSEEAHYDAQTQNMLLLGHPQVWDLDTRVRSQTMNIDMRTNTSVGEGKVQATHLPTVAPGKTSTEAAPVPTNVLADKMIAKRQSQVVHYEGHVRAWQGTDVVESSALDVFRTEKRMSSGSQVVTSFLQPSGMVSNPSAKTHPNTEMQPVTVNADFLEYLDEGRRARYHGNVRLVTESTTVKSDHLDVFFTQANTVEGSQVDHAVADGHVKVTQPSRVGTGEHADYFAGPGKIVLTGGTPTLIDEEKGTTTGQRLTFFIHDDRLFVDGGDHTPSLTRHRVAQ
jgi:lipopolysaccharide export system protein LptA